MEKTILVYCWDSVCEPMTIQAMEDLGYKVLPFRKEMKDYHADAQFAQEFIVFLHSQKVDAVFSYDYFPLISMICEMNGIPYLSWIYDCPQYTLQSKTIINNCNFLFCFDRAYAMRLQEMGAKNICHFSLASDYNLYEKAVKKSAGLMHKEGDYVCDLSFVGSLYNDKKNRLTGASLSETVAGAVESLIQMQQAQFGGNRIKELLTEEIVEEIAEKCSLYLGDAYVSDTMQLVADAINMEVTARDRQNVLCALATNFNVSLYSNSDLPESLREKERLVIKGTVDYHTQMPLVFRNSKINLNISSRTIETGVPQRVFDILACGGFCLTNYQEEIAELFEDGKELVMYTSMEDLVQKAEYYLAHDKERVKIAREGYEKVRRTFEIKGKIAEMLEGLS